MGKPIQALLLHGNSFIQKKTNYDVFPYLSMMRQMFLACMQNNDPDFEKIVVLFTDYLVFIICALFFFWHKLLKLNLIGILL